MRGKNGNPALDDIELLIERQAAQAAVQLKEACKATRARWAAWIQLVDPGPAFLLSANLSKARQSKLGEFIGQAATAGWLAGTLPSGRMRWRGTGMHAAGLGCQRLYVFPNARQHCALVVGTDELPKPAESLFRVLALIPPPGQAPTPGPSPGGDGSNDEPSSGDATRGEAMAPAGLANAAQDPPPDECLSSPEPRPVPGIGSNAFSETQLAQLAELASIVRLAPERFGRAPRGGALGHGRTEFDCAASRTIGNPRSGAQSTAWQGTGWLAAQSEALAGQAVERIREIFGARQAGIFLLAPERNQLQLVGVSQVNVRPPGARRPGRRQAGEEAQERRRGAEAGDWAGRLKSLAQAAVEKGRPVCSGTSGLGSAEPRPASGRDERYALAVPMETAGEVMGALVLEAGAQAGQDEQYLAIVASHLAGLFLLNSLHDENLRLQEEARRRDRTLQDTARQLQAVRDAALEFGASQGAIDLEALLERVLQHTRRLVDARGAELYFWEPASQEPASQEPEAVAMGAGRMRVLARSVEPASQEPASQELASQEPASQEPGSGGGEAGKILFGGAQTALEVAEQVAASGEVVVVNATASQEPAASKAGRTASIAGVPLKMPGQGHQPGQATGALLLIDDRPGKTFEAQDIELLELLAPLVEIWVHNAWLVQELQGRVKAQQVAEDRLVSSARLAAVGEMAAGVAHELNNPLTTVAGFIELTLEELPKEATFRPDLELALQEARRARAVVRRILDFARPAENQPVRSDLNELVSDVLTLVHHLVRTGGVEMHIELWHDLPWILVDPGQIKQVLLNLVHNAIQAMPQGGTLVVKTAPAEDGWLSVSVADSGVGISAANLERIFEPFFTTRPAGQGTGLGLSVSYGIIAEHGGSIEVESQLGQGSCFTIYLPVDGAEQAPRRGAAGASAGEGERGGG